MYDRKPRYDECWTLTLADFEAALEDKLPQPLRPGRLLSTLPESMVEAMKRDAEARRFRHVENGRKEGGEPVRLSYRTKKVETDDGPGFEILFGRLDIGNLRTQTFVLGIRSRGNRRVESLLCTCGAFVDKLYLPFLLDRSNRAAFACRVCHELRSDNNGPSRTRRRVDRAAKNRAIHEAAERRYRGEG